MLDDMELNWAWEIEDSLTKLLGFYIGSEILVDLSLRQILEQSLEKYLHATKLNLYSILVRVVMANQLTSNAFWDIIQLWSRKIFALVHIHKEFWNFV